MNSRQTHNLRRRLGFTIVELLVSVTIVVALAVITVTTLNVSAEKDRIPEGARSTASFIEGARDRAIFNRSPVGVRLLLDQNGPTKNDANGNPVPTTCSSMIYIGSPETFDSSASGPIAIDMNDRRSLILFSTYNSSTAAADQGKPGVPDVDDDVDMNNDNHTDEMLVNHIMNPGQATGDDLSHWNAWNQLRQQGLINTGVVIRFTDLNLNFTLRRVPTGPMNNDPNKWALTKDFPATPSVAAYTDLNFEIELLPTILPNQEPRELPRGVVIDLEASRSRNLSNVGNKFPDYWYDTNSGSYVETLDILFSPRGTMIGESSSYGLINLVLADVADVETTTYNPGGLFYNRDTRPQRDLERIVTINPQSGSIYTSPVDFTDGNTIPTDPFRYAETGETAP
ncbi:MAG: hypothetical protein HUJ26_05730 [Planctomycetaceae bacterium]|nr:hypothetical protein [Planctomycetaceae bacterium]